MNSTNSDKLQSKNVQIFINVDNFTSVLSFKNFEIVDSEIPVHDEIFLEL